MTMAPSRRWLFAVALLGMAARVTFDAAEPGRYRFTFPQAAHHWMQVEATFPDVGAEPLDLRVSR